jgi:hypothetical protein
VEPSAAAVVVEAQAARLVLLGQLLVGSQSSWCLTGPELFFATLKMLDGCIAELVENGDTSSVSLVFLFEEVLQSFLLREVLAVP